MRSSARSILSLLRILALVAGLVLLAPINPGQATDGRDFAGFYEVSNVADLGDTVRLTLTVRVYNYSDADVNNATVTLQDSAAATSDYGTYPSPVSIADRESIKLSADFTISREEYDRWQEGRAPFLWIAYQGGEGTIVRHNVELIRGFVDEEN
jgi:hypothetical protein